MSYPATVEVTTPERLANWRPLVQWLLAIPHLVIAAALGYVANAVAVVTWFIVLFTGRLPAGLANFQVMILRYRYRTGLYAGFLFDAYPPFEYPMVTTDPGGSPTAVTVHPALENRNRLTVGLRLLWAIPAILYAMVIGLVGAVCWVIAFFAVLLTGRWPGSIRTWAMRSVRVSLRLSTYLLMLTDEYPPFSAD
jgi:hypothetical protein